jgi:hypothetical protein
MFARQSISLGANGVTDTDRGKAMYIAVQMLVWETVEGERDVDFNYVSPPSGKGKVMNCVRNSTMSASHKELINTYYNSIAKSVQNHFIIPSFTRMSLNNSQMYKMTSSGNSFKVTLTDSNSVLGNYNFVADNKNVSFSKSGNSLAVTSSSAFSGVVNVTVTNVTAQRKGIVCYGDGIGGDVQDVIQVGSPIDDPVKAYFKLEIASGNLEIIKTTKNNGGNVAGFKFEVKDSAGKLIGNYTTGSDDKITIPNLNVGVYTVKEIDLMDEFVQPLTNPQNITVRAGQTVSVSFENVKKLGVITVKKTNANKAMGDYSLAGTEFAVKNASGEIVDTGLSCCNTVRTYR